MKLKAHKTCKMEINPNDLTTKIRSRNKTAHERKLKNRWQRGDIHVTVAIIMHFASGHEKSTATT